MSAEVAASASARDLPVGMVTEVSSVLARWGMDAEPLVVMLALHRVVVETPVSGGGRLLDDGSVLHRTPERAMAVRPGSPVQTSGPTADART